MRRGEARPSLRSQTPMASAILGASLAPTTCDSENCPRRPFVASELIEHQ
jgi:hypothetical protein